MLLFCWKRIPVFLMNYDGSSRTNLVIIAHLRRCLTVHRAFSYRPGRGIALKGCYTIRGKRTICIYQVCRIGSRAVDMHQDTLVCLVQPGYVALEINNFGRAPEDALSKVENHELLLQFQFIGLFKVTLL